MHDLDQVLDLRLDRFQRWAEEQGEPVPARPAAVLLTLLALRGARMRGRLPEPTTNLIRQVLCEDLPDVAAGCPQDLAVYPRVMELLIDQRRADGLLNAKRRDKLRATVRDALTEFHRAMAAPAHLTWPRFYGRLLRTDGVDPADTQAVHGWLNQYRRRPAAERRATLASALADATDGPSDVSEYARTETVVLRTEVAELAMQNLLLRNTVAVGGLVSPGRDEDDDDVEKVATDAADQVMDLGTAAGLNSALRGEFRDLAPRRGDRGVHTLMDRLEELCEERGNYRCLPPMQEIPAAEIAAAVRISPLLSAAADLASWVEQRGGVPDDAGGAATHWPAAAELGLAHPARREVERLAVTAGLLRDTGGRLVPGDGLQVWRDGAPGEVTALGLDAFGGVLAGLWGLAAQPALDGDAAETLRCLIEDLPYTLIRMFEDTTAPVSLARLAAEVQSWRLRPVAMDAEPAQTTPAAPRPADRGVLAAQLRPPRTPGSDDDDHLDVQFDDDARPSVQVDLDYQLPPDGELERLLGVRDIDDDDRVELLDIAVRQALIFDRLAALGVLRRDGDRAELTRPGRALLRLAFVLAGGDAPSTEDLAAVDAAQMLSWMRQWPHHARIAGLTAWLDAHDGTDTAWRDVLTASDREPDRGVFVLLGVEPAAGPARHRSRPATLPAPLPDPQAETTLIRSLETLVPDPVIGAYAAEALRRRGQPAAEPPWPARAVLLCDHLRSLILADHSRHLLGGPDDEPAEPDESGSGQRQPVGAAAVCTEFDRAASGWPGGARELVRHLAAAASPGSRDVLRTLANHPDATIGQASRAAVHTRSPSPPGQRTTLTTDRLTSAPARAKPRTRAKRRRR